MRRIKPAFKIAGLLVALFLVMLACITIYVHYNKEQVFRYVVAQIKDNINGSLEIKQMEPELLRHFPNISVRMHEVTIRDSLWSRHRQDLLHAQDMYVSVNILSFITGNIKGCNVELKDAAIYLYTDTAGYGNLTVFKPQGQDTTNNEKKKKVPYVDRLMLSNVQLVVENGQKHKYFRFDVGRLAVAWDYRAGGWDADLHLNTRVDYMMFNTERGGFLKGKRLRTRLKVTYDEKSGAITAPAQPFMIDEDRLDIGITFMINQKPALFIVDVKAKAIKYKNTLSFLSEPITSKLQQFDFDKAIAVQAIIQGRTKYRDTPYVSVAWQVNDNTFRTPGGAISHCTFTGIFNNERVKGGGYKDDNALVELKGVKGNWHKIPFAADTLSITNIKYPVLEGRFTSRFDVAALNEVTAGSSFHFDKGQASVNILYKGGVFSNDTTQPYMYGTLQLSNIGMTYVPRSLSFTNSSAMLRFGGSDLFVDEVQLQRGSTVLHIQGRLLNFLNLYYTAPEKIIWDWEIKSPKINLNEFIPLLASRQVRNTYTDSTGAGRIAAQLNRFLDTSSVHMKVAAGAVVYRHFEGEKLEGNITMAGNNIVLKDFSINHAGGKLKADVYVQQTADENKYKLTAAIEQVDVNSFFTAFENFGQATITDKNIYGKLSTEVNVTGAIQANGQPVPYSINGSVAFKYKNGALVNFAPFKLISNFVFRNRNLDSIAFRDIENKFTIQGDKIIIHPMYIESNALNMHLAGVYAIGNTGTDINIDLPLRNPKKDELIQNDELRHRQNMKGIVLHLKAVDRKDGKVKIKWNGTR